MTSAPTFIKLEHFQQLTPYAGLATKKDGQVVIFSISSGVIGMACQTGRPIVVRRNDARQWGRAWELMHFGILHCHQLNL
jgi:hypothetical protein